MKLHLHCFSALLLATLPLPAQQPPPDAAARAASDPFTRNQANQQIIEAPSVPKVVSVCVETFSLDLADAAGLYHKKLSDSKLYAELAERVTKGQAKQESFAVIRARSGERATLENISEFIYPTKFDHGNGPTPSQPQAAPAKDGTNPPPAAVPPGPAAPAGYFAPVLPTSFETRNTGFTLEIEPTISESDEIVDLRLSPDLVTLVDRAKWGQGVSEAEMPVFESQRLNTATTLVSGQPLLLGTPSRPPVSKVDADSAHRVWFFFVTADVVRIVKE